MKSSYHCYIFTWNQFQFILFPADSDKPKSKILPDLSTDSESDIPKKKPVTEKDVKKSSDSLSKNSDKEKSKSKDSEKKNPEKKSESQTSTTLFSSDEDCELDKTKAQTNISFDDLFNNDSQDGKDKNEKKITNEPGKNSENGSNNASITNGDAPQAQADTSE